MATFDDGLDEFGWQLKRRVPPGRPERLLSRAGRALALHLVQCGSWRSTACSIAWAWSTAHMRAAVTTSSQPGAPIV